MPTKRKPEPGDADFQWGVDDSNTVDRLLAEAHGTLDNANQLGAETGSARLANLPASLAALRQPMDTRGPVRKITEPLAEGGNAAMLAGIPAGAVNPLIGGAMLTGGGLATLPDYLRKLIAPEGDENRPGVVDTGMAGLAMLPAAGSLRGLRGIARGAEEASPLADLIGGRALGFEGSQGAGRARPAIDKLMATESFRDLPQGNVSKAAPRAAETLSPFRQMEAEGTFGGDRTTGQFAEGPSGLSAVAEGRVRPNEMPWEPLAIPSSKPLDPMERLAARSKERFGKKYRKE